MFHPQVRSAFRIGLGIVVGLSAAALVLIVPAVLAISIDRGLFGVERVEAVSVAWIEPGLTSRMITGSCSPPAWIPVPCYRVRFDRFPERTFIIQKAEWPEGSAAAPGARLNLVLVDAWLTSGVYGGVRPASDRS